MAFTVSIFRPAFVSLLFPHLLRRVLYLSLATPLTRCEALALAANGAANFDF
jgi:hypothetical protein